MDLAYVQSPDELLKQFADHISNSRSSDDPCISQADGPSHRCNWILERLIFSRIYWNEPAVPSD
jgi:hypothetical protein